MIIITHSHGQPLEEPLYLPVPDTPAWREAEALGIDLPMLYDNIRMTPEQRIRNHAAALASVTALRAAYVQQHTKSGADR
jgi:hypothetical protein